MNNIYQIAEKNLPASSWLEQPHSQEEKLCAPLCKWRLAIRSGDLFREDKKILLSPFRT